MITGYNTEVKFNDRVFHVQTEDKGINNPKIQTLIYLRGEVLDNFLGDYSDLLEIDGASECNILQRMDEQHKRVLGDIKNGKYESDIHNCEPSEEGCFSHRPMLEALLEYLEREGNVEAMELFLTEPIKPKFDTILAFTISARLCISKFSIPGAKVSVKFVFGHQNAIELASGTTNGDGLFACSFGVPPNQLERCTINVSCTSEYGSDEICVPVTG